MTKKHLTGYILAFVLVVTSVFTFPSTAVSQSQMDEPALEDLQFLKGNWEGIFLGNRQYEKYWSGTAGNAMMGMVRFIRDESTLVFELLTIEHADRGLVLRVKHFDPGLIAQEEMDESDSYLLIETGTNRAVFEHEGNGSLLSMEVSNDGGHHVQRGILEDGEWVWSDLFVGQRAD